MNMRSLTRIFLGLLAAVVLVTVGLAGGLILGRTMAQPSLQLESGADGQLIDEAWQTIQDNYVDQAVLTDETLTYGAIDGIVQALGDTGHSRFLTPAMVAAQHEYTSGEFEGIGAYVESQDGIVVIVSPIDNSPAQ
ncbi:MAG: hypothetical protein KDE34_18620, partial [Anaerolineales bacterium]|nr:hypothetical protein [Anaerolineales bacterium]